MVSHKLSEIYNQYCHSVLLLIVVLYEASYIFTVNIIISAITDLPLYTHSL